MTGDLICLGYQDKETKKCVLPQITPLQQSHEKHFNLFANYKHNPPPPVQHGLVHSDPPCFAWATSIVGDRGVVCDGDHFDTAHTQTFNSRLERKGALLDHIRSK